MLSSSGFANAGLVRARRGPEGMALALFRVGGLFGMNWGRICADEYRDDVRRWRGWRR